VSALLQAELFKQRSTRTNLGFLLVMLTLILFAVVLHSLGLNAGSLASRDDQMHVFGWGGLGSLFAGLVGAMSITGEIRHGTIRPTFLVMPRRGRVIAAKAVASALIGVAFGLVAEGFALGVGSAALSTRGIPVRLDGGDYAQLIAGGAVMAALWGPIGLGLGALLRNQVATLVGLFAWLLFVEGLLFGALPNAGRFLPGVAGAALAGVTTTRRPRRVSTRAASARSARRFAGGIRCNRYDIVTRSKLSSSNGRSRTSAHRSCQRGGSRGACASISGELSTPTANSGGSAARANRSSIPAVPVPRSSTRSRRRGEARATASASAGRSSIICQRYRGATRLQRASSTAPIRSRSTGRTQLVVAMARCGRRAGRR